MDTEDSFNKLRKLILKVKELSERGIDGERESAQKKLNQLLDKYGFEFKDIELKDEFKRTFRIKNREDYKQILAHVIWKVSPKIKVQENTRKLEVYCQLTNEEYIEACEMIEYYWKLWCRDKNEFLIAYIVKNGLAVSDVKQKLDNETTIGVRKKMDSVTRGNYVNKNSKLLK